MGKEPGTGSHGEKATKIDGCSHRGCKTKPSRFGFCPEHYEQFKFGLIKKTGEPVPDYDKKFEQYAAYKARRGVQKAA